VAQTRVTAGEWRGRMIDTPRGLAVRPTRSSVRESLFNVIAERVVDAVVLDLYAGAGTLGFEALSRGAARATFVERSAVALRAMAATAGRFGCAERCAFIRSDAVRYLERSGPELEDVDICFMDAPYRDPELEAVLGLLGTSPPRLVVCEHHERRSIPERPGRLVLVRQLRHGLTTLSLLQPVPENSRKHQ
jgi:16S rRNA (guanine966-N2)-methyltransferase